MQGPYGGGAVRLDGVRHGNKSGIYERVAQQQAVVAEVEASLDELDG